MLLALALWLDDRRSILFIVVVFGLLLAALDLREMVHLAVSAVLAMLHLAVAGIAAALLRQPVATDVAA